MESSKAVKTVDSSQPEQKQPVVTKLPKTNVIGLLVAILVVIGLGVATGWFLSGSKIAAGGPASSASPSATSKTTTSATEAGLKEEKGDTATGDLEDGGISGEGTHHLVRDGGPSKYVYLTSSVVDLSTFTGKKVQVWGDTVSSKKAGWLMQVNRIKVLQ
jgi:hypothetical protein